METYVCKKCGIHVAQYDRKWRKYCSFCRKRLKKKKLKITQETYKIVKEKSKRYLSTLELKRLKKLGFEKFACEECGIWDSKLHYHHIIPLCYGGNTDKQNIIVLCIKCHRNKHPELPDKLFK